MAAAARDASIVGHAGAGRRRRGDRRHRVPAGPAQVGFPRSGSARPQALGLRQGGRRPGAADAVADGADRYRHPRPHRAVAGGQRGPARVRPRLPRRLLRPSAERGPFAQVGAQHVPGRRRPDRPGSPEPAVRLPSGERRGRHRRRARRRQPDPGDGHVDQEGERGDLHHPDGRAAAGSAIRVARSTGRGNAAQPAACPHEQIAAIATRTPACDRPRSRRRCPARPCMA